MSDIGEGVAQLVSGVPLTTGEVVTKMLTFAALTLVAGGLLTRMAHQERATQLVAEQRPY